MEIYECILALIAGVGVFVLAMKLMSNSLNELAGEKMKTLLGKIAGNKIKGVLMGALVTAVIQSSSATTVMVIGFVNVNVMSLNQAAAIIIGSNIGTTATGLLASLESLNISLYLSLLVFIGVMLAFIKKIKKLANLMVGLGMIFVGLKMMSSACNDDSIKGVFQSVLEKISFPLLLELLGVVFTAIIQSSSAMTGIVIVMVGNKVMNMHNGLFITLGANVGTCVTALIGIIGANKNSKRTAVIHLIFNISGCLIFTPILWILGGPITSLLKFLISKEAMQIAYFHLFFNCTTALITTPLIDYLVRFAKIIIKDEDNSDAIINTFIQEKENIDIGQGEVSVTMDSLDDKITYNNTDKSNDTTDNDTDKDKDKDTDTDKDNDTDNENDKDNDKEKGDENVKIDKKDKEYEPPKDLIDDDNNDKKDDNEKIEIKDVEKKEGEEKKEEEKNKEEEEKKVEEEKEDEIIEVKEYKKEEKNKNEDKKEEEKRDEKKMDEEKLDEETNDEIL